MQKHRIIQGIAVAAIIGVFSFTWYSMDAEKTEYISELEHKSLYTYSMKYYDGYSGVKIDTLKSYPNQIEKYKSGQIDFVVENYEDTTKHVIISAEVYNTDYVGVTEDFELAIMPDQRIREYITYFANDQAGIYFGTHITITISDFETNEIYHQVKVPLIVTSNFERSYEELLEGTN